MKLIILLICLGLDRFLKVGSLFKSFCWFEAYSKKVSDLLPFKKVWNGMLQTILLLIIVPIAVLIVACIFKWFWFGLLWFLFSIAILVYCLAGYDLHDKLALYVANPSSEDNKASVADLAGGNIEDAAEFNGKLTRAVFAEANKRLFAVMFWFLVLGVAGAVFYRMATLLQDAAKKEGGDFTDYATASDIIVSIFNWVPVRLCTLSFVLMGDFMNGFAQWTQNLWASPDKNNEVLMASSYAALSLEPEASGKPDDVGDAVKLIDRSVIVWLVVVAILTIVAWLA